MKKARTAKKGKGYIRAAILAAMIILAARAVIGIRSNAIETVLLEYGEVKITEQAKGVVVREETVIKAPISGTVTYAVPENIKVPAGKKVLEIKKDRVDERTLDRYNEIKQKIEAMGGQDGGVLPEDDPDVIGRGLSDISRLIHKGKFLAVYYEKEQLLRDVSRSTAAAATANELNQLILEKEKIEREMDGGIKAEYAQFPAVPVYTVDGYEEVLTVESVKEIIPSELSLSNVSRLDLSNGVEAGEPVLKLVDNSKWYIVAQISEEFGEGIKDNANIGIQFVNQENVTVKGRVISVETPEQGKILVLEVKDYVPEILEDRFIDIIIIKERYSGFVVPQKAIIEKGGETEVMVMQEGKMVDKKVVIRASDGVNAVIESDKEGPALKLYDNVVINWERYGGMESEPAD